MMEEADKTGESDFSPGQTNPTVSLLPLPTPFGDHLSSKKNKKRRGFTARFSSSSRSKSSSSKSPSSSSVSTTTSPLLVTPSPIVAAEMEGSSTCKKTSPGTTPPLAVEESSGSSGDDDSGRGGENKDVPGQDFRLKRKVSVNSNKDKNMTCEKEGYLMKQTSSFQRWHKRYFKILGKKLLYGKDEKSQIFEEVDLSEVTIAESSSKSCKNSFQVITPHRTLHLGTEKRSDMISWTKAIKAASEKKALNQVELEKLFMLLTSHNWSVVSHTLPTYCNVCRDQLLASSGLSCEICKLKSHKRCAIQVTVECKWTSFPTMEKYSFVDEDREVNMPHQWLEGNLPLASKCRVCSKGCGSVLRLQDWQCLWCDTTAHNVCKCRVPPSCRPRLLSVVPPWALRGLDFDASWLAPPPLRGASPLLVFVNSKSGNNQGLSLLTRFKQLLNPVQVFDLLTDGPTLGLQLFKNFQTFRILVCGGDGSVGWVMAEVDRLSLHKQCHIGILPLGTGNDLARVLGWGASFPDDAHLSTVLLRYERATTKMLDRWGVLIFERDSSSRLSFVKEMGPLDEKDEENNSRPRRRSSSHSPSPQEAALLSQYETTIVTQLRAVSKPNLNREEALESGRQLCEAVKKLVASIGTTASSSVSAEVEANCGIMTDKMNLLLQTVENFEDEEPLVTTTDDGVQGGEESSTDKKHHAVLERANSLEKALSRVMQSSSKSRRRSGGGVRRHVRIAGNGGLGAVTSTSKIDLSNVQRSLEDCSKNGNGWSNQDIASTSSSAAERTARRSFSYKYACTHSHEDDDGLLDGEEEEEDDISEELAAIGCAGRVQTSAIHLLNKHPTIEIESPSTSSSPLKTQNDYDLSETDLDVDISLGMEQGGSNMTLDESPSPDCRAPCNSGSGSSLALPPGSLLLPRGASPRASRRVSTGSLLKPTDSGECSPTGTSSSSAASAPPSPHKTGKKGRKLAGSASAFKKKTLPIVNPLLIEPSWSDHSSAGAGLGSGGFIGRALIQNVDTICAVASPLMDMEEQLGSGFKERCVMNNYFGIGIDAKITLAFHLKREEHPELCGSRIRNFVWYGILGGREFMLKSCRNLEQRVILECDGQRIFLPSLQGIVILNIQSFMGGTNFWGGSEADSSFLAPSFDDRILEVVAVYDVMQMAASRVVHIRHHRIAQCHSVKITILGDDPLPVQVDGEAWLQAPGAIQIVHKNRVQMMCRNRELEFSLKAWDKLCEHQANGGGGSGSSSSGGKGFLLGKKGGKKSWNNRRSVKKSGRRPMMETGDTGPSSPSSPHSSGGDVASSSTEAFVPDNTGGDPSRNGEDGKTEE
ncbi:diacylglycerol kinase delta isoform X4 [Folsomia candida]|uniref:diacylglycerol kinase delta isoform X4 n=1 Tax=Folsomia candida TaxID=158441 RepID=UPI00160540FE|nr:diacylglycerol kinase delta isoform X4 [Folsomia candida]